MKLSSDTEAALEFLTTQQGELRKRNDMGVILEIAATNALIDDMNNMVLVGKNVYSCYGILRKMSANDEGYKRLEHEFMTNVHVLRGHIGTVSELLPELERNRFETVYLGMTQGTVRNIVDLAHDLSALKNLQNNSKYGEN